MIIELKKQEIKDLYGETDEEYKFALFAYKLLHGIDINGHWLQLKKLNEIKKADDPNKFEVDYGIFEDDSIVGYIDLEKKTTGWHSGVWPYPKTNIPLYPMAQWDAGKFNGNHTVKLQRFIKKPDLSFWIGVRTDWSAFWVVRFKFILEHGKRTTQQTRYSRIPLPIIEIGNEWCSLIDSADDFTRYITDHYKGDEW